MADTVASVTSPPVMPGAATVKSSASVYFTAWVPAWMATVPALLAAFVSTTAPAGLLTTSPCTTIGAVWVMLPPGVEVESVAVPAVMPAPPTLKSFLSL